MLQITHIELPQYLSEDNNLIAIWPQDGVKGN